MLSPTTIADSLIRFHEQQTEDIEAFWIESPNSRQELASRLQLLTANRPILVATVRSGRFNDPNGVVDDLSLTIQENEIWFTPEKRTMVIRDQKFSVVLVSKRPLGVPQLSSPVTLPDWFPLWPSRLLTANIKSIGLDITLSLASTDIPEATINSALFDLEKALGNKLSTVLQSNPASVTSLQTTIANNQHAPTSIIVLVTSSKAGLQLRGGDEFRPGGGTNSSFIVSHFARLWRDCAPKDRQSLAVSVADALGIATTNVISTQFSLTSLLNRGKEDLASTPSRITFCRNLLGAVSDIIQFINARHHADEFPQFPAVLTIAFARELANSCRAAANTLNQLP